MPHAERTPLADAWGARGGPMHQRSADRRQLSEIQQFSRGFYLPNAYRSDPNLWAIGRQSVRVVKR